MTKKFVTFLLLILTPFISSEEKAWARGAFLLQAPLILTDENRDLGMVWVKPSQDPSQFELSSDDLIHLLSSQIQSNIIDILKSSIINKKVLTLSKMREAGIDIQFDDAKLELLAKVKPEQYKPRTYRLEESRTDERDYIRPSIQSGYINVRTDQKVMDQGAATLGSSANPALSAELVEQVNGLVFHSGADLQRGQTNQWQRQMTQLTYDFESSMVRLTAGEISPRVSGYQNSSALLGGSAFKEFGIQPLKNVRPVNRTQIVLQRPSQISVYVNGVFYRQISASAGLVNLSDFPSTLGLGEVLLKVTDSMGQTEEVHLTTLFDAQLLGEGVNEFSYSVGVAETPNNFNQRTYGNEPQFLAFHRIGVSPQLTLGSNFQSQKLLQLFGLEAVGLTSIGIFFFEPTLSHSPSEGQEGALKFRFRTLSQIKGKPALSVFELGVEGKTPHFTNIARSGSSVTYPWVLSSSISRSWTPEIRSNIGVQRYFSGSKENTGGYSFLGDLSLSLSQQWLLNLNANYSPNSFVGTNQAILSLTWMESSGEFRARSSFSSPSNTTDIELARQERFPVGDWSAQINGSQQSGESRSLLARTAYKSQRVELGLLQQSNWRNDPSTRSLLNHHTTSVQLGSALAWTSDAITISKPIQDSFILFPIKNDTDQGFAIDIAKTGDRAMARSTSFLPGVLSDVSSYYPRDVALDPGSLPFGTRIQDENFHFKPRYRSGSTAMIRMIEQIQVVGFLESDTHTPLSYLSGELTDFEGNSVVEFFTNSKGKFVLEAVPPGLYQMKFYDSSYQSVELRVEKPKNPGRVDLGKIVPAKL